MRISRIERKYVDVQVSGVLRTGAAAAITGVDVTVVPKGAALTSATMWMPAEYHAPLVTLLIAGPDAPGDGALVIGEGGSDIWGRVTDRAEIDAFRLVAVDLTDVPDGSLDTSGGPAPTIVPWSGVLNRLGIQKRPGPAEQNTIRTAIEDVSAAVEAYLGRSVQPRQFTQAGCWPFPDGWHLPEDDIASITSAEPEVDIVSGALTGRYTVRYMAGLDVANDPTLAPIRHYITMHALNQPGVVRLWRASQPAGGRQIKSASTDGQSVSYDYDTPTGAASGAVGDDVLPAITSLDRWRVAGRRAFQRAGTRIVPGWDDIFVGDVSASTWWG